MPKVSAVTVENSAVRRSVRASGVTQPKSIVTVSTEISGTIRKLPLREGTAIARGDIIVSLNTNTLPVRIEAAEAEIAAARAAHDSAVKQAGGTHEEACRQGQSRGGAEAA